MSKKYIAVPGEKLYVIEEYLPGTGTYSCPDGWIRSSVLGAVYIDNVQKIVYVKHVRNKPNIPKPGDIIIGVVSSVSEDLAFIDIFQIEGVNSRNIDFTGVLHISQASDVFINTLYVTEYINLSAYASNFESKDRHHYKQRLYYSQQIRFLRGGEDVSSKNKGRNPKKDDRYSISTC